MRYSFIVTDSASADEPAIILPDEPAIHVPVDNEPEPEPEPAPVEESNEVFHISSSMSNGYIELYRVDTSATSLKMFVETSGEDGTLTVTLPRSLIDSKSTSGNDEEFVVFLDGRLASFDETRWDSEQRTLTIDVPANSAEIEVEGGASIYLEVYNTVMKTESV